MLLLLLVGNWVHDVEANILACMKEQTPEMALSRTRMK